MSEEKWSQPRQHQGIHWLGQKTGQALLVIMAVFLAMVCSAVPANAEKMPQSLVSLQQAGLIVVGTIEKVRVESERSEIERKSGNYDWGVYVTLAVEKVEKGILSEPEIEFRCFRVKSRRTIFEYISSTGHDPIPPTGTKVRVYLDGSAAKWSAVEPNGITPPDADTDDLVWPDGSLSEAAEVSELRSLSYTYLLPLELWGLLVFVFLPLAVFALSLAVFAHYVIRHLRRKRLAGTPRAASENQSA
ncbi:MAG: hypothetical protein HN348_25145 [Proteobacteria bacterium]|jgi:hypothetical protein|nr:hypothetical protein [Pseudomonadota bacterium]